MSLPRQLFTPVFHSRHLGRSFAVIVGVMVFIATFATAVETGLYALGSRWGETMESRITVEIPAVGDESSTPQAERVAQATAVLRAIPEIGMVMPMSDEEVERLLRPWFNQPTLLRSLPLPTLIDVERKPGAALAADKIQAEVRKAVSDAQVDDHGAWTQDIWRLVRGLGLVGGMTILLTAASLVVAVGLLCRAVMASERDTIALLHLLGAADADIANHFKAQAESLSWRAAALGFGGAAIVTACIMFVTRHIANYASLTPLHWAFLAGATAAVPVVAIFLTTVTARRSVLSLLGRLP